MNKLIKSTFIITILLGAFAFTTPLKKQIDTEKSIIVWTGKKIVGSSHTGTLKLKEGYLEMDGDILQGGMFVVDMTTLKPTGMDETYGKKLEGHLKSDDFFGVSNHPTATLIINDVTKNEDVYKVIGDLAIKGITESISFDLNLSDGSASTTLQFDRTKFGVRYGSGSFFDNLGDKAISDIIELDVTLKY